MAKDKLVIGINPIEKLISNSKLNSQIEVVDWSDLECIKKLTIELLLNLMSNLNIVKSTIEYIYQDYQQKLQFDDTKYFTRLILFEPSSKLYSIRLMSMKKTDYVIPHNHRGTFGVGILSGEYVHKTYLRKEKELELNSTDVFTSGDIYYIDNDIIHSTEVKNQHFSLMVRANSSKGEREIFFKEGVKKVNGGSDNYVSNIINDQTLKEFEIFTKKLFPVLEKPIRIQKGSSIFE